MWINKIIVTLYCQTCQPSRITVNRLFMKQICLKNVKRGDYFKRFPSSSKVYIRGDYERIGKKYSCIDYDDSCREIFLKGSAVVYIDLDF